MDQKPSKSEQTTPAASLPENAKKMRITAATAHDTPIIWNRLSIFNALRPPERAVADRDSRVGASCIVRGER